MSPILPGYLQQHWQEVLNLTQQRPTAELPLEDYVLFHLVQLAENDSLFDYVFSTKGNQLLRAVGNAFVLDQHEVCHLLGDYTLLFGPYRKAPIPRTRELYPRIPRNARPFPTTPEQWEQFRREGTLQVTSPTQFCEHFPPTLATRISLAQQWTDDQWLHAWALEEEWEEQRRALIERIRAFVAKRLPPEEFEAE